MLVVTWGLLKEFVGMQESKDVLNYEKMHSIDKRRAAIDSRYRAFVTNMSIFIQLLILCIRMRSDG